MHVKTVHCCFVLFARPDLNKIREKLTISGLNELLITD